MNTFISKEYSFDASHQLVGHKGKCANLHGHTYTVMVELHGVPLAEGSPDSSSDGMVLDYTDLDEVVKPLIEKMDHAFLSDGSEEVLHVLFETESKIYFLKKRTTAENIAEDIWGQIALSLPPQPNLFDLLVSVSETPKTKAIVAESIRSFMTR